MLDAQNDTLEQRLDQVATEYLEAVQAGGAPDRQEWLARYPDLAEGLTAFFAGTDRVRCLIDPLSQAVRDIRPASAPSIRFGDYELLREIGSGGNGVVYEARQLSLNRVLALKMVRIDQWSDATERQRLRNEAETAALLDHPLVVPVYEVGERDGQMYFSMKKLDGGSLADRLDRFNTQPRLAAQTVARIARAVHHAHQRGVLHRDLKPSNILLNSEGQPHVADFGLARRFHGEPGTSVPGTLTHSGAIVGTPGYMAPEQTMGDRRGVTTAADVYGLGGILYALLTGQPPFRNDDVIETMMMVRECDPEPPHRRNPLVGRDLSAICLKCLEKDPKRRYASAEALAEELEHYLAGEPILARPIGRTARLWRWCRRKPQVAGPLFAAALLAVLVLVGLPVSTFLIWREQQKTETARQQEMEHRQRADNSYRLAQETLTQVVNRVTDDPRFRGSAQDDLRRAVREDAKAFYEQFLALQGDDPGFRLERARAYMQLGYITQALGSREEGLAHFRQALVIFAQLAADHPDVLEYQEALGRGYNNVGDMCRQVGRPTEAEQPLLDYVALSKKLVRDQPGSAKYLFELGFAQNNLGLLYCETNRLDEAWRTFTAAWGVLNDACRKEPTNLRYLDALARTEMNFGLFFGQYRNDLESALRPFEDCLAHSRILAEKDPNNPDCRKQLALVLSNLGGCYWGVKQLPHAEKLLKEAVEVLAGLTKERPRMVEYQQHLASAWMNLAFVYKDSDRLRDAEHAAREALSLWQKLAEGSPSLPLYQHALGTSFHGLATVLLDHDPAEARRLLEKAIAHHKVAMDSNARNADYRDRLRLDYIQLDEALLRLGEHAAACKAALAGVSLGDNNQQAYTTSAQILARCVPLARKDTHLPEPQRQERATAYARQSVEMLEKAVNLGFVGLEALKQDRAFDSLVDREDYKSLLRRLESKRK